MYYQREVLSVQSLLIFTFSWMLYQIILSLYILIIIYEKFLQNPTFTLVTVMISTQNKHFQVVTQSIKCLALYLNLIAF